MASKKMKKAAPKRAKAATRKPVKRTAAKARATRKAKAKATPRARPKTRKAPVKPRKAARPAKKTTARRAPAKVVKKARPKAPAPVKSRPVAPPATLQRQRRRLPEAEDATFTNVSDDSRLMSSARAGHDELRAELKRHTQSSPTMTAGDVDARWQDAYALGDEAPGGDNMTPDQDRVDDIGKALGIEYADDEELLGGEELTERDEHRWELDPASKEDDDDL